MMRRPDLGTTDDPVTKIARLFHERGGSEYGGEAVTQLEHALQAAMLAEDEGAGPALVAAALLHDVGHLLHDLPDDAPDRDIDDHHEALAARWLAKRFGPDVVEPVRLHVPAKRYLCATESGYLEALSPPSLQSLRLQGGPMTPDEALRFESSPHFESALRLRRWDEAAKVPGLPTPGLEHFLERVRGSLAPGGG
jgi:phosphonate degradation associated HDIG domain protein